MKSSLFVAACFAFLLLAIGCDKGVREPSVSQENYMTYKPNIKTPEKETEANQNVGITPAMQQPQAADKVKVAILLPLSGDNRVLGQAMLNAAQQAIFDSAGKEFELQPRDTAAEGGAEAAARAAVDGGARLIIGPLFASDIPSVKAVAQGRGLMVLPLSTDTSLAERGVYVMGLAPGPQVKRVVDYAAVHGIQNFAALVPLTPYGKLVGEVFRAAVGTFGGKLIDFQYYDPLANDLDQRIQTLALEKDMINGLFLPLSGNELKLVADRLLASGFTPTKTRLLGTGLWDVADVGRLSPLLIGGWFAAPEPSLRRNFISGYSSAYGEMPPRLATLAYDATALASILSKRQGLFDERSLTNPNGFAGLDGIFRLQVSGEVERGMAVNEVTTYGIHVVDPAPTSFQTKNR